jgi:hypothetical protein
MSQFKKSDDQICEGCKHQNLKLSSASREILALKMAVAGFRAALTQVVAISKRPGLTAWQEIYSVIDEALGRKS